MNSNGQDPLILESLDELVTALTEAERTKYGDIIGSLKLKKSALEDFCSWSSESYTRNCITENDKF